MTDSNPITYHFHSASNASAAQRELIEAFRNRDMMDEFPYYIPPPQRKEAPNDPPMAKVGIRSEARRKDVLARVCLDGQKITVEFTHLALAGERKRARATIGLVIEKIMQKHAGYEYLEEAIAKPIEESPDKPSHAARLHPHRNHRNDGTSRRGGGDGRHGGRYER